MSELQEASGKYNALMVIVTIVFMIIIGIAKFSSMYDPDIHSGSMQQADMAGQIVGALIMPLVVMGLFQFGKKFRNRTRRIQIVFATTTLLLLSTVASGIAGA